MTDKTEQASETTDVVEAEDNLPIDPKLLAEALAKSPLHIKQCVNLTSIPDALVPVIRCFSTTEGKVFLGILLAETEDSFLVGAPIRLIMGANRQILSETLSTESVLRFMKSGISYVTTTNVRSTYFYYTFLSMDGRMYLPELLTEEVMALVEDYLDRYDSKDPTIASLDLGQMIEKTSSKKEVPGASEFAFTPLTVSEKIH